MNQSNDTFEYSAQLKDFTLENLYQQIAPTAPVPRHLHFIAVHVLLVKARVEKAAWLQTAGDNNGLLDAAEGDGQDDEPFQR